MSEDRTAVAAIAPAQRIRSRLRRTAAALWRRILDTEIRPLQLLARRLWSLGGAERTLLVALAAFAATAAMRGAMLVTHLGLFVLAWAAALGVAASQPGPGALLLTAPWLIFYIVLVAGVWAGTPFIAIPIAWLAWVFLLSASRSKSRWAALIWWTVAAAGFAYVTAGPSGLRRALGWDIRAAQAALFALTAATGAIALRIFQRRPPSERRRVTFAYAFAGALLCGGGIVAAAAIRDPSFTHDWSRTVISDAAAIVVLFWLWTAGSFAGESLKLFGWTVGRIGRALPMSLSTTAPIVAIALITIARWLWPVGPSSGSLDRAVHGGEVAAGILATAVLATWAIRGTLTSMRGLRVLALWAMCWIVGEGVLSSAGAVIAASQTQNIRAASLLIVVCGLAFELSKLQRDWSSSSPERLRMHLGFVVVAVACAVSLSTFPGNEWETTRSLMVLAGMLHVGVPVALYEMSAVQSSARLPISARVLMFAAGYATALVVLSVEPLRATTLIAAIPILAIALIALRRRNPELGAREGALVGGLFGGGLIAGWMMPYPPTVPFVPVQSLIDVLRDIRVLGRAPLSTVHIAALAAAWLVGAAIGALVFGRGRRS